MKFGPFELTWTKAIPVTSLQSAGQLNSVEGGGWFRIFESFAGAWQQNVEITLANVTTHPAVFACTTQIANDIAKMRLRLVQQDSDGIWSEVSVPSFSPVLRKPNHFENRIQFVANWVTSKLLSGNTYVLKVRDNSRDVQAMYVLDPSRVRPLVAPNGDVFYEIKRDDLSQLPQEAYTVPATEIIHDRWNCLFHPLVGLGPIYASGLAAVQGLNILNSSANFFANGGNPGGVVLIPGAISPEAAARIKAYWDTGFSGDNAGKVAVLADNATFQQMKQSAVDSQLTEQWKQTAELICSTFHVPAYMVGFAPPPSLNNVEALNQQYYSQCLQILIESIELCLDEGMGLTSGAVASQRYGTEFDIEDLLRMDSATQMATLEKGKNYFTPNDGRQRLNLKPVTGGDTVYRQQQDFSLEALNKRDAKADPFAKTPAVAAKPAQPALEEPASSEAEKLMTLRYRAMAIALKHLDRAA